MIYNLTEKFLLLFPFYREQVRVMDSYALRLSEAVEALAECKERLQAQEARSADLNCKLNAERATVRGLMKIAIPAVEQEGSLHGASHIEAFHGIPQPDMVAFSLYPNAPGVHYAFVKAFNQSLKPRQDW